MIRIDSLPEVPAPAPGADVVRLPMTAADRARVRRVVTAPDGVELALALPTGTRLMAGQVLHQAEGKAYVVEAEPEDLLLIRPKDWREAAFAAHFIGNLHRDIEIQDEGIAVPFDPALAGRLGKAGVACERITGAFHGKPRGEHSH